MKKLIVSIAAVILLFTGFSIVNSRSNDTCINLYVDYASLDNGKKIKTCVDSSTDMLALDVLRKANIKVEGTQKYGLGVVCRINGLPDRSVESCEVMPPEDAFWAIIIKEKKILPIPSSEWGWGQLAVDKQFLSPGDSIGFVFNKDGDIIFP